MEQRKSISLIWILVKYMVLCILAASSVFLGFWAGMSLLLGSGVLYAANAGERMAQEAAARMEQEGITRELVPELCGYVIWEKGDLVDTDLKGRALQAAGNYRENGNNTAGRFHISVKKGEEEAVLQYSFHMQLADPAWRKRIPGFEGLYMTFWGALFIGALVLLTFHYVKVIKVRLKVLQEAAVTLSRGELERPLGNPGIREYNEVMKAMEQLQSALRRSLQEQWKMEHSRIAQTSALVHDLKTPLTVIDGNTQLLAETKLTEEQREYVDAVLKNTAEAGEYLERLRKIARSPAEDSAQRTAEPGERMQTELLRDAEELCRVYGLTVKGCKTRLPELTAVWQDIKRAVLNIVRNGAEHTPRGGQICLQFIWTEPWLEILVTDEGPGFTKKALRHGLEPMYTEAESRPQNGHMGIGLAFAQETARLHGGSVQLSNTEEGHGRVSFRIRMELNDKWENEKEQEGR